MAPRSPKPASKEAKISVARIKYGDKRYKCPIPHNVLTRENLPNFLATLLGISEPDSLVIARLSKSAKSWTVLDSVESYRKLGRALSVRRRLQLKVTLKDGPSSSEEPAMPNTSDNVKSDPVAPPVEDFAEKLRDFVTSNSNPHSSTNNSFDGLPEEIFEKLTGFLAKQGDFLNSIGDYIATNTPVLAGVVDQLVKEIQSKVVEAKDFQDKIQSEVGTVVDKLSKDIHTKVVDAKEFQEKLQAEVAKHVQEKVASMQNAHAEAKHAFESSFAEPADTLKDVHKYLHDELRKYGPFNEPYRGDFGCNGNGRRHAKYPSPNSSNLLVFCDICNDQIHSTRYKCFNCPDYDLCSKCIRFKESKHIKSHMFEKIQMSGFPLRPSPECTRSYATSPPPAGAVHIGIECNECNKAMISGIRFKCLTCPDFDLCEKCILSRFFIHRGHRFVKIRSPDDILDCTPMVKQKHTDVSCDGFACVDSTHCIYGPRYMCTTCKNFDLCASCEADPNTDHDPRHIFVKLNQPTNLSVDVFTDDTDRRDVSAVPDVFMGISNSVPDAPVVPDASVVQDAPVVPDTPIIPASPVGATTPMVLDSSVVSSSPVDLSTLLPSRVSPIDSTSADIVMVSTKDITPDDVKPAPSYSSKWEKMAVDTVSVHQILQSEKSNVFSITLRNSGDSSWPVGTYLASENDVMGSSSVASFPVYPGESHSFVVVRLTPTSLDELNAVNWSLNSEDFVLLVDLIFKKEDKDETPPAKDSPSTSTTLSSSEVILPRLPVESRLLNTGSEGNSHNSSSSFFSAKQSSIQLPSKTSQEAMNDFMSSNRFSSDRSTVDEQSSSDDEDAEKVTAGDARSETFSGSVDMLSVPVSPSLTASISGAEDVETELLLDEDDMFTDSDYELVESDMIDH